MSTAFSYRIKHDSSDNDSDDSDAGHSDWKRDTKSRAPEKFQAPIEPPPASKQTSNTSSQGRKRNNIWSDVLQDQMISETLTDCGLKMKPKGYGDRGSESYDYTLARKYYKNLEGERMSDGNDSDLSDSSSVPPSNGRTSRNSHSNNPHFVDLNGAEADAARKIIKVLCEKKKYLIFRAVKYIGIEKAMALLTKTEEIEDGGGMMIKNNSRRRTPGGVYLQLLRTDPSVPQDMADKIFEGEMNSFEIKRMFDDKKKRRKELKAAKKVLLKEVAGGSINLQSNQQQAIESKTDDCQVPMEEESEQSRKACLITHETSVDLEDGEIDE